jgi:hypothetical protein
MPTKNDKVEQTVEGLEGSEPIRDAAVNKDTRETPAADALKPEDREANSLTGDVHEPPVRTHRPDVPILQRLATGAGQHHPVAHERDDVDTASGRFIQSAELAPEAARETREPKGS